MKKILPFLLMLYIRRELPGWGKIYSWIVGGYRRNSIWADSLPCVIRDKRYGLIRILNIREWADRSFYFLGRWYDLETQLFVDHIVKPGDTGVDVGANYGIFR